MGKDLTEIIVCHFAEIGRLAAEAGDAALSARIISGEVRVGHCARFDNRRHTITDAGAVDLVLVDGDEADVDGSIAKQCGFDPDLWVIEVEDRHGRHLLDEPGLE